MNWREAERTFDHPALADTTLPRMFEESAERNADRVAQRYKGGVYDRSLAGDGRDAPLDPAPDGGYDDLTYAEYRDVVRALATGFSELGVRPGDRVGIFAETRMEWAHCDFGVLAAGGVVTTVYASSSEEKVRYLLDDAEADGVVVQDADALERVLAVEDDLDLSFVVVIDEYEADVAGDVAARDDVQTLAELHALGDAAFDADEYESWLDARDPADLASLVYTSGTTGRPKGVRLSHHNFRANVNQCFRRFGPRPDAPRDRCIAPGTTALSYLPLAHVFEREAGHFMMVAAGATVAYAESPDTLREDFGLVRPNVTTSVPRVYEKLFDAIREQAGGSPVKRRIFEWAVDVGRAWNRTDDPGAALRAKHAVADRLVFSSVREALGGEVDFFISGGGSLSADLCGLYHAMGLPVLEGYGLTETSPVVSANPPVAPRVGTIGPPVVDTELRVDESVGVDGEGADDAGRDAVGAEGDIVDGDDSHAADENAGRRVAEDGGEDEGEGESEVGELLVRGPQVTDGYWNRPGATERAFTDDGWFRTGDVVEVGPDGYVTFRERTKQILKLSTGKMVAPGPIEDAFVDVDLVEQCMVVGDDRKFVGALLVPNHDRVRAWADEAALDVPEDPAALCADERVRERIQREVDAVNEAFESHERIKRFALVPEEFTEDNDLLTPTMKKKRRSILERYADEVESMYADRAAPD